ncbi:MAG: hypothetical protein HQ478_13890 [Chloroflexi bacterium]|nr:hypothetical protein [Chloroflexota bacterium]
MRRITLNHRKAGQARRLPAYSYVRGCPRDATTSASDLPAQVAVGLAPQPHARRYRFDATHTLNHRKAGQARRLPAYSYVQGCPRDAATSAPDPPAQVAVGLAPRHHARPYRFDATHNTNRRWAGQARRLPAYSYVQGCPRDATTSASDLAAQVAVGLAPRHHVRRYRFDPTHNPPHCKAG